MRLSDAFRNLGQPVVYYPKLVKPLGSPEAVILFCQLLWWQDKTDNELGVYKSIEELEKETGLTYKMQRNALKKLIDQKLIIKTHVRSEHKLYFKVDFDVFDEILESLPSTRRQLPKGKQAVDQRASTTLPKGKRQLTKGQSVIRTENTTEITTDNNTSCDFPENHDNEPEPIPDKKFTVDKKTAEQIADLYNEILHPLGLSKCTLVSDKRHTAIKTCWMLMAEYKKRQLKDSDQTFDHTDKQLMLITFERFFHHITKSDYLMGQVNGWKADFDFIFTKSKFLRILEKFYHNNQKAAA